MIAYKFCPKCATTLQVCNEESVNPYVRCPECGFVKWNNPLPTTIGVIARGEDVLLLRRAIEPMLGAWDVVGGFLGPNESAEDCLQREALEEIGSKVIVDSCLGTFPSVYGDTGLLTIGIAFVCRLESTSLKLSSENAEYSWFNVADLPRVAFRDVSDALELFRNSVSGR